MSRASDGALSTAAEYATSIAYARRIFGARKVRDLGPGDVRRLLEQLRGRGSSPATQAKHLRQLGACLQAAVTEGYTSKNAVRLLHKSARPKVSKSLPVFYTDAELARLWPELAERPVMLALCKTAVATGMRIGELCGLWFCDLHVRKDHPCGERQGPHVHIVKRVNPNRASAKTGFPALVVNGMVS